MPSMPGQESLFKEVALSDKYLKSGRILLSGTQALLKMVLLQRAMDQLAGLDTACFISGYRGSPLGGFDLQLQQESKLCAANDVHFVPGVNEELAATSVWGSQQAGLHGDGSKDGVFGIWYGKGPGVDRTGDAFRHANLSGTAMHGGVIALLGDDHTCESSTTCHQSEFAMVDAMIPTLNPAGIREIIEFGLHGWAMSRFSGCWVGVKCVHDTISATASIDISDSPIEPIVPSDVIKPRGGLNIRLSDTPREQEKRLIDHKLRAAQAYARANDLDRVVFGSERADLGIVTTGKSYLDVRQALSDMGIDERKAEELSLAVYKIGLVWPLDPEKTKQICGGFRRIIVIEEKRDLIEGQLKTLLYGLEKAPQIVGKTDANGQPFLRSILDLDSKIVSDAIARFVLDAKPDASLPKYTEMACSNEHQNQPSGPLKRTPYFCAGCPHSSSTHLPEGSRGMAGIGCAWMSQFMERRVEGYTQMGGEGATWIGEAPFSKTDHIFQNLGDGTYFHSGHLAVRAAIAANANITFKILFNDAVAMTGGQAHDGQLTPWAISWQVYAEGAKRIAVVTDAPSGYPAHVVWAPGVEVYDRRELNSIQKQLRETSGTTILIYDQTCAAEKRRRRKRGTYPDPAKRLYINPEVCEGCGDCGRASNCTAILPLQTELGRKREISQSNCNKDYSCVEGFCPSFITVIGGKPAKQAMQTSADIALDDPCPPTLDQGYRIVITGVGGTGVVTVGAILAMAAHLEGKGCAVLDMTGMAQKGGAVLSHLRLATRPEDIGTIRIAPGQADLLLGFDNVVSTGLEAMECVAPGRTQIVVNTNEVMPGEFARNPDLQFPTHEIIQTLVNQAGAERVRLLDATRHAEESLGDSIAANMLMTGFAYQKGLIPLSANAILRAIEINGAAVKMNQNAFIVGRQLAAHSFGDSCDISASETHKPAPEEEVHRIASHRIALLTEYQNAAYARRYEEMVQRFIAVDREIGRSDLALNVAKYYSKLLAYKDEYEVARLHSDPALWRDLRRKFSGDVAFRFNLAPPLLARKDKDTGKPLKSEYGAWWLLPLFRAMAWFKRVRGTAIDPFGFTHERGEERRILAEYERLLERILAAVDYTNYSLATELACLPEMVRGFGHVKAGNIAEMEQRRSKLMLEFGLSESNSIPFSYRSDMRKRNMILFNTSSVTNADLLAKKIEIFVRTKIVPFEKDRRWQAHGPSNELVAEMRSIARSEGLLTPHISPDGSHLSHAETAKVLIACGLSPLGPAALNVMAPDEGNMYLLGKIGTPAQKGRHLSPLLSGLERSAFLMTEPASEGGAGSDPSMLMTSAEPTNDGWVISGRKALITGIDGASTAIIMARTGDSATMFLARLPNPAVGIERILDTLDNSMPGGHAIVNIDGLEVKQADVLGEVDKGYQYAQVRLAPARLTHCMRWLGSCIRANEIAADYVLNRKAFGQSLIDHEGVGFMLAENEIALKQTELMIFWCAAQLDGGSSGIAESSLTKTAVAEALFQVADRCVQMMGGSGVSQDTVVQQIFREVRAFRIYDGPTEVHKWSLAKRIKKALLARSVVVA